MKQALKTVFVLAGVIVAGIVWTREYMGMEPLIVRESDIRVEAEAIEEITDANVQILKVLLGTEETAGQFTMFSDVFPLAGGKVPPHTHNWHDETFYVIRGSFRALNGDMGTHVVGANTVVFTPRGQLHEWESLEDDSKFLVFYTPGGWEHYYNAVRELTDEQRADDEFMKNFQESYDEYFQ